jgi:glycosyltransferase involved in cell wall biosynthesis
MATYNGVRWLPEQLDSIYAQTWPNLEVVVTDDASADDTVEILTHYARKRGLRYEVNPTRLGLVKNFERAISLCRGDYIALSDQDDVWKPHKIETLLGSIGEATLIYGNTQEFFDLDSVRKVDATADPLYRFVRTHGSGQPTRYLLAENWVICHSLLFKKELVRHALPIPSHQRFHDGWLALVASKLGGIRYFDEPLQVYRQHPDSLTWVDPQDRKPKEGPLRALWTGQFRERWRDKCEHEISRLSDAQRLPVLDEADRQFILELLTFYSSGMNRGFHWRAFIGGLRLSRYFCTLYGSGRRWRFPLRPLLAGL